MSDVIERVERGELYPEVRYAVGKMTNSAATSELLRLAKLGRAAERPLGSFVDSIVYCNGKYGSHGCEKVKIKIYGPCKWQDFCRLREGKE